MYVAASRHEELTVRLALLGPTPWLCDLLWYLDGEQILARGPLVGVEGPFRQPHAREFAVALDEVGPG